MSGSNVTLSGAGGADLPSLVASLVDRVTAQAPPVGTQGGLSAPAPAPIITSVTIRG